MEWYGYAWEKLYLVVSTLASSRGSVQDRLCNAWVSQGTRLQADKDLPPEVAEQFNEIEEALTHTSGPEGSIKATTAAMTDEVASDVAEKIVRLFDEVWRLKAAKEVEAAKKK